MAVGPWILAVWALASGSPWDKPKDVIHLKTYEECRSMGVEYFKQGRQFECINHKEGTSCRNMQCS